MISMLLIRAIILITNKAICESKKTISVYLAPTTNAVAESSLMSPPPITLR